MPYAQHGLWYEESGSGEPVVLLHEGVVDSRIWAPVVPLLADRFRVVAYDQRGYGRSPIWDGPYSPVDDLVGVLDAAGITRAALVGASRGGRIALATALLTPERVSALVLVGSGLPGHRMVIEGTPEQEARWEAAEERGDTAELAELDLEIWARLGADGELRAMFLENAEASNADDPAAGEPDVKSRLGEIAVPTLVITGAEDVPAINEVGEILASGIPGARSARLDDADHMIPWRAPEELGRLVRQFLAA
ncbi:MAG: alpha/beta hydrolase [Actinomycetota bacterium]|nr:alpha/beta hydrolase [Actinomycetota bacterium]